MATAASYKTGCFRDLVGRCCYCSGWFRRQTQAPTPPPPHVIHVIGEDIVSAIYDYEPRQQGDLAFRRGDKMQIIDSQGDNSYWLTVKHLTTHCIGDIPRNYVLLQTETPESQPYWFDFDRRDSEKSLLTPGNARGVFLLRAGRKPNSYVLSVLDFVPPNGEPHIRHYRVKIQNESFFIAKQHQFPSIMQLVEFYRKKANGLCCKLTEPCPKNPELIPFKNLEVDRSDLTLTMKLGGGKFGEVWAGKWKNTLEIAIKNLKPGAMTNAEFLQEANILHRLRHHKLVQLLGVCTSDGPMYIITELMVNGSLLDYLKKDKGRTVNFINLLDISAQIADGMAYLEANNYIHRDLRAANILVGQNNIVKVADFGLARLLKEDVYRANEVTAFPIRWTAPEAAQDLQFSIKSDVWSYGVLLFEIVTYGRQPYLGMTNREVLPEVLEGYRMPKPMDCPDKIYDKMSSCWNIDPSNRPTFEYLAKFFDDYTTETERPYKEECDDDDD